MGKNNKNKPTDAAIYRRLLTYVIPYRFIFLFSIIGFMIYGAVDVLAADLMQYLIDSLGGTNDLSQKTGILSGLMGKWLDFDIHTTEQARWIIPVIIVVLAFIRGIGSFIGNYAIRYVGNHVVFNIRQEMFKHMMELPASFISSHQGGSLVSKITFNVNQVSAAVSNALTVLFREGMTALMLFSYLLYLNWKLTATFFLVAPFVALLVNYVSKRFRRLSKKLQNSMGDVTQVIGESVNANRDIRLYGAQESETERFYQANGNTLKQQMKIASTNAAFSPIVQVFLSTAISILVWLGLSPEIIESMTPGLFVSFLVAASAIGKPLRQLTNVLNIIQKALAAADDIFHILDQPLEKEIGDKKLENVKGDISFQHVSFSYPRQEEKILNDISFDVKAGEMVALVGGSGGGKSTLVNLIPRFFNLEEGKILIDGQDIQELTLESLRSHIALVSQNVVLLNDTIRKNIAYGELASATDEEIVEAAKQANAHEFIEAMPEGYDTRVGDNGLRLSGGQRQRIAIARAILKNAPILILDEATSALDNESERLIQNALNDVTQRCTSFVIAHRLSTIEKANKILVVDGGRIIEQGSHEELLAQKGRYFELHHSVEEAEGQEAE